MVPLHSQNQPLRSGTSLVTWHAVRADFALGESTEPQCLQVSLRKKYNAPLILEQKRYNMSL